MRRPPRGLVALLVVPFLVGCFTAQPAPLPAPERRADTDVRGVVLGDSLATGEQIEFGEIYSLEWGPSELAIQGLLADQEDAGPVQRSYDYSDMSGVLVRQLDVDRTSILIGSTAVVAIATLVYLFAERSGVARTVDPGG